MKFILASDFHLPIENPVARKDNGRQTAMDKLGRILFLADKHNAHILQAGDLSDRPRSWTLLPDILDYLKLNTPDGVKFFTVFGQHDTFMYSESTRNATTLGILEKSSVVSVLGEIPVWGGEAKETDAVMLYGASFGADIPKVNSKSDFNILVTHRSIGPKPYDSPVRFLKAHPEYKLILVGDIHERFIHTSNDGRTIVNTGPIFRAEANEWNLKNLPMVAIYDTDTMVIDWEVVSDVPGKDVLSRAHIDAEQEKKSVMEEFCSGLISESVEDEESVNFMDNLRAIIKNSNVDKDVVDLLSSVIQKSTDGKEEL